MMQDCIDTEVDRKCINAPFCLCGCMIVILCIGLEIKVWGGRILLGGMVCGYRHSGVQVCWEDFC